MALLHNSEQHKRFFLGGSSSTHTHRLWHAQLRHTIEHRAFHPRFRALGLQAPRPESASEQHLEPEHRVLGDTLPRVPTENLPRRASVCLDLLQDVIAYSTPPSRIFEVARVGRAPGHEGRRGPALEHRFVTRSP